MERDVILHKVRTALGRSAGQEPTLPPPARVVIPEAAAEDRVKSFCAALEALAGTALQASSKEQARDYVASLVAGKTAVASNAPFLAECGVTGLAEVRSGINGREELRELCATADFGITSAEYALADTGTLVMLSSPQEARMVSLLPPVHIALLRRERILTGLDELLSLIPLPAERTSSMVLITGPSRTADLEQILIRGVHGPGQIHVILV